MEATFQPAAPVGSGVESAYRGIEQADSMMQRASQLRQQQQMEQLRQDQIEQEKILMPVKVAQAKADIITAGASVALATRQQQIRQQAGAVANQANDEFLGALKLADWESQGAELAGLQAKYSWMGTLPEYKPFLEAVDKARANAINRALTDQTIEGHMEQARILSAGREKVAGITGDTRETVAQIAAGARTGSSEIAGKARVDAAQIAADTRASGHDATTARTEYKTLMTAADHADANAVKMEAQGNADEAKVYKNHAKELRDRAAQVIAKPPAEAFRVPGVTDKPAVEKNAPTQEPVTQEPKLYLPPEREGMIPDFSPEVKTDEDRYAAVTQMINDHMLTGAQAREYLISLGWTPKSKEE